jgi:membrane protease YdiL (CAAX protease family)
VEVRSPSILPVALTVEAGALLLAFLLGRLLNTPPFAFLHVTWLGAGIAALALLPPVLFAWWSLRSQITSLAKLRGVVYENVVPRLASTSAFGLLLISLAAGVCEEALFRGVLQTALADMTGPVAALAAVSLLFGLLHPVSPIYILLAASLGAYLGGLLIVTGNLFVPIVVHAAYDFVAITLLLRAAVHSDER